VIFQLARAPQLLRFRLVGSERTQVRVLRGADEPSATRLYNDPSEDATARRSRRAVGILVTVERPINVGQCYIWLEELNSHCLRRPTALEELVQARGMFRFDLLPPFPVSGTDIHEVRVVSHEAYELFHVMVIP